MSKQEGSGERKAGGVLREVTTDTLSQQTHETALTRKVIRVTSETLSCVRWVSDSVACGSVELWL